MSAISTVIETTGLSKTFGTVRAVDGLNLAVHEGEMFGLVGPDGAGKTTTIRMLCGILVPTSGSATVLGYDILKDADRIKKQIGYLSQRFSLYGDLTVDENIEFFAEINRVYDFRKQREELLEFTRLTPFRNRPAEKLSGGMKQKLALACTLIHTPRILLLDEPTTGVDPVSRRDLWKILQNLLGQGITIFMSTPYLDEAERCTRVGLMNKGGLLHVDSPSNIKKLMKGEIIEVVCDRVGAAHRVVKELSLVREVQVFGDRLNIVVHRSDRDLAAVLSALESGGIAVESWRIIVPSLENVFISLLTQDQQDEVVS
jgi:ABC-2 type transport system ATP-binding protein